MNLFFKESLFGKPADEQIAWIHPSGNLAVLIDLGTASGADTVLQRLVSAWDARDEISAREAIELAQNCLVAEERPQVSLLAISHSQNRIQAKGLAWPHKILRVTDRSALIMDVRDEWSCHVGEMYIAATSPFRSDRVSGVASAMLDGPLSDARLERLGADVADGPGGAMLAFPFEAAHSYVDPNWPYNPFAGTQEERAHERRGLASVAHHLFQDPTFHGFRIVGGEFFHGKNWSNMPDGLLISPWGVFVLELKDIRGTISIHENSANKPMAAIQDKKMKSDFNPIHQLEGHLRSFQNFNLGIAFPIEKKNLRRYGILVFTNPGATIKTIDDHGKSHSLPRILGQTIVCTPSTICESIKRKMGSLGGTAAARTENSPLADKLSKLTGRPASSGGLISQDDIDSIVDYLSRPVTPDASAHQMQQHGRYIFSATQVTEESSDFYSVYEGHIEGKSRRIWVKEYLLTSMGRGDGRESEIQRLRREIDASQDLPARPNIQRALESWDVANRLFVALDYAEGMRLDAWSRQTTISRKQRLDLLVGLAGTLNLLSQESIVHRALTPNNIRVTSNGDHVLINFELCKLPNSATIVQGARSALDGYYQAPETMVAGRRVTPAADTYSFGKIVCLVLSATTTLPFENWVDQQRQMVRPVFWSNIAQHCGLSDQEIPQIQALLALDPSKRAVGERLTEIVEALR